MNNFNSVNSYSTTTPQSNENDFFLPPQKGEKKITFQLLNRNEENSNTSDPVPQKKRDYDFYNFNDKINQNQYSKIEQNKEGSFNTIIQKKSKMNEIQERNKELEEGIYYLNHELNEQDKAISFLSQEVFEKNDEIELLRNEILELHRKNNQVTHKLNMQNKELNLLDTDYLLNFIIDSCDKNSKIIENTYSDKINTLANIIENNSKSFDQKEIKKIRTLLEKTNKIKEMLTPLRKEIKEKEKTIAGMVKQNLKVTNEIQLIKTNNDIKTLHIANRHLRKGNSILRENNEKFLIEVQKTDFLIKENQELKKMLERENCKEKSSQSSNKPSDSFSFSPPSKSDEVIKPKTLTHSFSYQQTEHVHVERIKTVIIDLVSEEENEKEQIQLKQKTTNEVKVTRTLSNPDF